MSPWQLCIAFKSVVDGADHGYLFKTYKVSKSEIRENESDSDCSDMKRNIKVEEDKQAQALSNMTRVYRLMSELNRPKLYIRLLNNKEGPDIDREEIREEKDVNYDYYLEGERFWQQYTIVSATWTGAVDDC